MNSSPHSAPYSSAAKRAFAGTLRKTVEHGIRAGELLAEAKSQCKHGTWLPWLEQHFEGAPRTAQEYMRLYNHRDEIRAKTRDSAHLSIGGALKGIAASREGALGVIERMQEEGVVIPPYPSGATPGEKASLKVSSLANVARLVTPEAAARSKGLSAAEVASLASDLEELLVPWLRDYFAQLHRRAEGAK